MWKTRTQIILCIRYPLIYEPAHNKTYNKTCATSEDLDQTAHPRSLIRVFADRMCRLQPPGYPKGDERESLPYWVDVHADLSLCWLHRSYCRFCRKLAFLIQHVRIHRLIQASDQIVENVHTHKHFLTCTQIGEILKQR